jgi:hypothetical protein
MKSKLLTKALLVICCLLSFITITGQTDTLYYIKSSFETPEDQAKWTSTPAHLTVKWDYDIGGHNYPINAKNGSKNAIFYWSDFGTSYTRTLVSKPIDLSGAVKPELSFWHAQAPYIGQDELRILFKAGSSAPWDTIATYTNTINDWTQKFFNVDEIGAKYLCSNFYIGFQGLANGGQGVCVDSVVLKETSIINKYIKSVNYQAVNHLVVGSGTKQAPLIRVEIIVMGNNGASKLNSIAFKLNSGDQSYFNSNGFRLYHTTGSIFKNIESSASTQIGTSVSISGNTVQFTGLNRNLKIGSNYLWLAADIADNAPHGSQFTFGVNANSISYNTSTYPASAYPSIVTTILSESRFYDNFDALTGWALEGDFEIAVPQGRIIDKSKDPAYAFSNTKVLGTDLTDDGAYPDTIHVVNAYHATSPMVDLRYYDDVKVYMRKWIDFNPLDRATIDFSTNGGESWFTVWQSQVDNPVASTEWEELLFSTLADQYLSKHDSVKIRFTVLETNTINTRAGFNIDNFTITGNHLITDVGISDVKSPFNDCIGCGNDTVKVVVSNYAESQSPAQIPIYYGIWGAHSILVHDTIMGPIPKDGSTVFTFSTLADFPKGDIYDKFFISTDLDGDEDPTNDSLTIPLRIQDSDIPPVTVDFEYKGSIWAPSEGSTWSCLKPDGSIPVFPGSEKTWILSPTGDYHNSDTCYLESNCFDMTHDARQIIEFSYWLVSEAGNDGFSVEYTSNDGATWNLVDSTKYSKNWNWYRSYVTALGTVGHSGNSNGWKVAREILPSSLYTEDKVKFRFKWASDSDTNGRGLAIDNFKVFPAPPDVGVSYIDIPRSACQLENPDSVKLYIKNYGYSPISTVDTMIVGVNFESQSPVIKSFHLPSDLFPGDSIAYKMHLPMNIDNPGTYNLYAYTMIEDNPFYYGSNNDTTWKSFSVWLNPLTGLEDVIFSRRPDTVVIRANVDPKYTYNWSNNTHNSSCNVTKPGYYYLTVTETDHSCQVTDSILIQLLFNDVGVNQILAPVSSCELGTSEKIEVQLHNFGTDSLITGDTIRLYYQINSNPVVNDYIVLNSSFHAGENKTFRFENTTENFSAQTNYLVKSFAYFGGDTIPQNDTVNQIITVYGYPDINLGNDTTIVGLTYNLQADPSFATYLWNDGDTNQTKLITASGIYSIIANDIHGCPATDSIYIWFKIRDVRAANISSPLSSCDRTETDKVTIIIQNSGTDTIQLADNIYVSYQLNSGTRVNDIIHVGNLKPGQTYQHNFTPSVDLINFGTYAFNLTAYTDGDLRSGNDTLDKLVYTSPNPVVDLGIEDGDVFKQTSYTFDAGTGENWTYKWQDGSTNRYFTATSRGTIKVLVTDTATGCYGGDTAILYLDILDYRVMDISINSTPCQGLHDNVTVTVKNSGNLSRGGAEFTLQYILGNKVLFTENQIWTKNWSANQNVIFNATKPIYLSSTGNDNLNVIIKHEGDLRPENDTLMKAVSIKPQPVVNLGGPTIYTDLPYTINAGSGHAGYLWSTGATSSSITVTQNGLYIVTVTGVNGCETRKWVGINMVYGIDETVAEAIDLKVYPNPASENVTIEAVFNQGGTYLLEIYNTQNSLVLSREINTSDYKENIYLGGLSAGIYIIRVHNNDTYHVSKLIIR